MDSLLFVTRDGLRGADFADLSAARHAVAEATPSLSYSFFTHFHVSCMYLTSSLCCGSIRPVCDFWECVAVFLPCTWNTGFGELHHVWWQEGEREISYQRRKRILRILTSIPPASEQMFASRTRTHVGPDCLSSGALLLIIIIMMAVERAPGPGG